MERRRHIRIPYSLPTQLKCQNLTGSPVTLDGTLQNISASGAALRLIQDPSGCLGEGASVEIKLARGKKNSSWCGQIQRVCQEPQGLYVVALQFETPCFAALSNLAASAGLQIQVIGGVIGVDLAAPQSSRLHSAAASLAV